MEVFGNILVNLSFIFFFIRVVFLGMYFFGDFISMELWIVVRSLGVFVFLCFFICLNFLCIFIKVWVRMVSFVCCMG